MDLSYFITPNPNFGAPEWVFFIAQFVVAIAGAYLTFMHADTNPVRGSALRRLGYAMLILGLLGAIVGALRRSAVEPFTAPYWMTIITVLSVALIIYAIYYARAVYPGRLAAWEASQRGKGARAAARLQPTQRSAVREGPVREEKVPTNGAPSRPSGSRRAARREHKKRNK